MINARNMDAVPVSWIATYLRSCGFQSGELGAGDLNEYRSLEPPAKKGDPVFVSLLEELEVLKATLSMLEAPSENFIMDDVGDSGDIAPQEKAELVDKLIATVAGPKVKGPNNPTNSEDERLRSKFPRLRENETEDE